MPSSVIKGFAYDPAESRLDVDFVSGRRYSYHEVPERIAERMRRAISKGSFFNHQIRDRYRYSRVI
jgi:hypothetical protein